MTTNEELVEVYDLAHADAFIREPGGDGGRIEGEAHLAALLAVANKVRAETLEDAAEATTGVYEFEVGYVHDGWATTAEDVDAHYARAIRALTIRPERKD